MRPRFPSWMRSRRGSPDAWYFLAMDTTRRRFDWTKVCWACSPVWILRFSSRRLAGVRSFDLDGQVELGGPAPFDGLGQADLVVLGEQRVLADIGQVEPDQILLVALDALLRQRLNPSSETSGDPCRWSKPWGHRMQFTCGYQFTDRSRPEPGRRGSRRCVDRRPGASSPAGHGTSPAPDPRDDLPRGAVGDRRTTATSWGAAAAPG